MFRVNLALRVPLRPSSLPFICKEGSCQLICIIAGPLDTRLREYLPLAKTLHAEVCMFIVTHQLKLVDHIEKSLNQTNEMFVCGPLPNSDCSISVLVFSRQSVMQSHIRSVVMTTPHYSFVLSDRAHLLPTKAM